MTINTTVSIQGPPLEPWINDITEAHPDLGTLAAHFPGTTLAWYGTASDLREWAWTFYRLAAHAARIEDANAEVVAKLGLVAS